MRPLPDTEVSAKNVNFASSDNGKFVVAFRGGFEYNHCDNIK